jgi:hypothetical protein
MVRTSVIMILVVLSAACGQDEPTVATATPVTEDAVSAPTSTPPLSPTESPSPTPTTTPEPITPTIDVDNQTIDDSSQIMINKVTIDQPGWIVIQSDDDGEPGYVLGFSQLDNFKSENITVGIDPKMASSVLFAVLYIDRGITGVFEFPGPDTPVKVNGMVTSSSFTVDNQATLPSLTVSDQVVSEDGIITVDAVRALADGYLALHTDQDGDPGSLLAFVPVDTGLTRDLPIKVNQLLATPIIHAVLYEDLDEIGHFDPNDEDPEVHVLDQPVSSSFLAKFPPDVFVFDQPVVGESIVVEKVVSYGPGWLVVYNDDQGSIGMIIGWAALDDGINVGIEIEVNPSAATPLLHLMIHEDLEDIGQFEFPRTDPPVLVEDRVPHSITVRTDSGNYLITQDQHYSDELFITIPLVVVGEDAWVVVRTDSDGEPGEIVGRSWVSAGVSHDVSVKLDQELLTDILNVMLHLDGGASQEFEYPDGVDIPLQRNRTIISAPMTLLTNDED